MFVILAQGAWYAEFVFLYYKIAMASLAVLLGSSAKAPTCLALMALVTAALLVFVLVVKPFDDGSHESPEMLTKADKLQADALGATLTGTAVGFDDGDPEGAVAGEEGSQGEHGRTRGRERDLTAVSRTRFNRGTRRRC